MESRVAENLRAYSTYRNRQLEKIIVGLPPAAEYSSTFHSVTLITSVICIVAIYAQVRALTLFSLHPTCMIIGCFMFLSEGIVAYHNRSLLDTLSPIMQHNKKTKVSPIVHSFVDISETFCSLSSTEHSPSPRCAHCIRQFRQLAPLSSVSVSYSS
jgi:hypothetical protein